ncbi:cell division protein FtsQ/DivIB [Pelagibacterium montanilacus]|uniref:cell division protein FtsQ/DivIB n=1 Tax=Pelagibacterium montanilacus TaxID=2185280 RepID=UPI000F8F6283|nr:cell division protein FtsQ/DivIB [Pelagibacterium montanilacus]
MQQVRRDQFEPAVPVVDRRPGAPSPQIARPRIKPIQPFVPAKGTGRALMPRGKSSPLPAILRRRSMLVSVGHLWVLHRRLATRILLALALAGLIGAAYVLREEVAAGFASAGEVAESVAASNGFAIAEIEISGQALTREADIVRALALEDVGTTLTYDVEAARLRIEEIPSVDAATIRRIYPDSIDVTITEKTPVARWRIDGRTMLVDARGTPIAPASFANGDLTLVIGEGAADDALPMINLMERFPDLTQELAALSRIADRRWDLIYYTGLRVQLPETGVVAALDRLDAYHRDHLLLDRDLDLIDMRVPQYVAVRPTVREDQEDNS